MRALTSTDMHRSLVPQALWPATREQVKFTAGGDLYFRYLDRIESMFDRRSKTFGLGLWVWGDNGRGKTGAAVVALKLALAHGHSALFLPAVELVRAKLDRRMFDEEEGVLLFDRAKHVKFLVLDDFGKEFHDGKGLFEVVIEELIRFRVAARLPTWITANVSYSKAADPEEPMYRRSLLEAVKERTYPVKVDGPDWRVDLVMEAVDSLREDADD